MVSAPSIDPADVRAWREPEGRWVAGVATGIAANLGWPLPLVRVAFVVLALANGLGVIAYLAFWAVLPLRREQPRERGNDFLRLVAFGLLAVGVAIVTQLWTWGVFPTTVAVLLVLGVGIAMLWQHWGQGRWGQDAAEGPLRWIRPLVGVCLVALAVIGLVVGEVGLTQGLRAIAVILLLAGGVALLALPWLLGVYGNLAQERRERIHAQARAEVAVKVHDSVLQTLALIQANPGDPTEVSRLARAEERRLRSWLYEPVAPEHSTLASSLLHQAARIENDHGVGIDVVQVGDVAQTPELEALVAAAGEAMVNAAKHCGTEAHVRVYCEVDGGDVRVFVRDRGPGFDLATVPADRHGVRDSIMGRMDQLGGTAEVVSTASGTEVRLSMRIPS